MHKKEGPFFRDPLCSLLGLAFARAYSRIWLALLGLGHLLLNSHIQAHPAPCPAFSAGRHEVTCHTPYSL
jgi:hypothetical protein